jgi:conjugative relaxase-like TrwC/TraI family protein
VLTVKKVRAGRGAVGYYLDQTRRGLADYYLPDDRTRNGRGARGRVVAPGSAWWGGGARELGLGGGVGREAFVPVFTEAAHPRRGGGHLGRRFRLPDEAAAAKRDALRAAAQIADPHERWMATLAVRRGAPQASVAAWDATFSPPKSVSLLWAAADPSVQQEVWAGHLAAVDAALAYLQDHAAYVRAGRNGVRVLDTSGLVVARMNEWTSRDGDMHLHTHCLILNRAKTLAAGKWRALDGRALLAARTGAGALYQRTLEAQLTRRLGVAWRDRPDGLRELQGVDDELIVAFSSRRRAITAEVETLAAAYREKYGVDPPAAVRAAMGQTAWATTRRRKQTVEPADALAAWEATARAHGRQLTGLPARILGRAVTGEHTTDWQAVIDRLLDRLANGNAAALSRHDLLRAALDVLPPESRTADELHTMAQLLVDWATRRPELVDLTAPDVLDVPDAPDELRRRDGTSIYTTPDRQRWALKATLDQEAWLLEVAAEPTGRAVDPQVLDAAVTRHGLSADQAAAVRGLVASDRRVGLLVGPAGAGKTRTLRTVAAAWQHAGGEVLGLTVSQNAARILGEEAWIRVDNTAKWLHETRRGTWQLRPGTLVIVDEATMLPTADLVDLVAQVRHVGGRMLLVGDPAQLGAIGTGGGFDLLADRHGAAVLHEVRRFSEPWQADASLQLRRRDPAAIAAYAMRGRIHAGSRDQVEDRLFAAWHTDITRPATERPRSVAMIVATNEQAAALAARARHALIHAGVVVDGQTVQLRDNPASVGDQIVTRRNDRTLHTDGGGWVANGDIWTILTVHRDGSVQARRHHDAVVADLPADYLRAHAHLAYATTAHRAQGMTVDICHAAITPATSHEQLYVAATRGRDANHLWVTLPDDDLRGGGQLPAPEQILDRILHRRDPDRLAAHQVLADSLREASSLARLGAVYEDAAGTVADQWLRDTLTGHGLSAAIDEPAYPALRDRIRSLVLAGHNPDPLLSEAIGLRDLDTAHSTAAVLHYRLDALAATLPAPRWKPFTWLPPADTPAAAIARQAADLIWQRWHHLHRTLAGVTGPLPYAPTLGPRPADPHQARAWLDAATAITAYRERYDVPDPTPMLGPRPAMSRPDARAAWDHAQHLADRHLARRLRHLDEHALTDLDTRLQALIGKPPHFDPAQLQHARSRLDAARRTTDQSPEASRQQHLVSRLENAARAHQHWQRQAADAHDTRRQITLEFDRRRRRQRVGSPVRGPSR